MTSAPYMTLTHRARSWSTSLMKSSAWVAVMLMMGLEEGLNPHLHGGNEPHLQDAREPFQEVVAGKAVVDQVTPGAPLSQGRLHGQDVLLPSVGQAAPEPGGRFELSPESFLRRAQGLGGLLKHFPPDGWDTPSGSSGTLPEPALRSGILGKS